MKVSQATALRKSLRTQGASLKVVKNRLALRALAESVPAELRPAFRKPTAVAYTSADPIALAKTVKEFAASTKAIALKGGLVEGIYFAPERFDEIVKLAAAARAAGQDRGADGRPAAEASADFAGPPVPDRASCSSQLKDKKSKETTA